MIILGGGHHSPAWFATQTQIKTFGSTARAPPPLQSCSRLHASSLLHQQFLLCWELKGASEHWELSAWCRIGLSEWVRGENPSAFMWALWIPNYEWLIVFGLAGHTPAHLHSLCWTTLKMNLTWDICCYKTTLAAKLWHKPQTLQIRGSQLFLFCRCASPWDIGKRCVLWKPYTWSSQSISVKLWTKLTLSAHQGCFVCQCARLVQFPI